MRSPKPTPPARRASSTRSPGSTSMPCELDVRVQRLHRLRDVDGAGHVDRVRRRKRASSRASPAREHLREHGGVGRAERLEVDAAAGGRVLERQAAVGAADQPERRLGGRCPGACARARGRAACRAGSRWCPGATCTTRAVARRRARRCCRRRGPRSGTRAPPRRPRRARGPRRRRSRAPARRRAARRRRSAAAPISGAAGTRLVVRIRPWSAPQDRRRPRRSAPASPAPPASLAAACRRGRRRGTRARAARAPRPAARASSSHARASAIARSIGCARAKRHGRACGHRCRYAMRSSPASDERDVAGAVAHSTRSRGRLDRRNGRLNVTVSTMPMRMTTRRSVIV